MCGNRGVFFEKYLKIIVIGLKLAENGEPKGPIPWQGCGKFDSRAWQRASYPQTEIAHASAGDGDASISTRDVVYSTLPIRRPRSTTKVMKREQSRTFSYSVFYEQAPEDGYVAFVPALPGCHAQGGSLGRHGAQRQRGDCSLSGELGSPRRCNSHRGAFVPGPSDGSRLMNA